MSKLTKKQAAERLGLSTRSLERYAKKGKDNGGIDATYDRNDLNQLVMFFEEDEVERFKAVLDAPPEPAATPTATVAPSATLARVAVPEETAIELATQSRIGQLAELIEAAMTRHKPTAADVAAQLMLTVEEAATYAGVGRSAIDAAIRAGDIRVHRGLGRGRRLKRSDVEEWIAKL